jgi:hypothetical protein
MTAFHLTRSEELHRRVRRFIDERSAGPSSTESFDALALALAAHQFASRTGVERLFASIGCSPDSLSRAADIPAVPTDVFKLRRVACHTPDLDIVVFMTSGTTLGTRGRHALRDTSTYRRGARAWGKRMLCPDTDRLHFILLAPPYAENETSSLGFMLDDFSRAFGASTTWALRQGRVDVDAIRASIDRATHDHLPVILAGASFAFVHLLDAIGETSLPLGEGGRVMQTGGFKGKSREINGPALREMLSRLFEIPSSRIVAEYGMTELGSQAYEGCLSMGMREGVFLAPPWMRVRAVHPETLDEVRNGDEGLARIEDLTNVDSAVAVQTADRIRLRDNGFVLLGRCASATPRGCSIGIDEILDRGGAGS